MLNLQNTKPMSKDEIRSLAPSIFQTKGSISTSDKYCHISTEKVIDDMNILGWYVSDVKEVKARKNENIGFQKHLVIFRNNDIVINGEDDDVVYPQILLSNSSDGKNSFTFTAGLFRMICENGLVISTEQFEKLKVRHYGYSFEELENVIKCIVEKLPLTVESLNKFKETELGKEQAIEFAKEAMKCRYTEEEINNITIDYEDLLTPVRNQDEGNNLWSIYNVLQEKLTHGLFKYGYSTKQRKARKIKNFSQDMVLNEKLYNVALKFVS